jgi:DNA-binding transcriptional regulator YiaG
MKKNKEENYSFQDKLLSSLKTANDYHDGKITLKTSDIKLPKMPKPMTSREIKKIREKHNLSQPVFALFLGVSDKAYKRWEQEGKPSLANTSLRLLEIAAKTSPEDFRRLILN